MRDCVAALAGSTFREAVRDRLLLVIVVFGAAVVLGSRLLGWLSVEDDLKMLQDFSLSGLSLLSVFLAMLVGAFSLAREVERRTAATVLSRDVRRGEFILAKFLGLVLVFWTCLAGAAALLSLWLLLWGGHVGAALCAAVLGLLCESLLLTAVALFFGSLTGATVAAVGTFAFYVVGHATEALRELASSTSAHAGLFDVIYHVVPNLEDVNFVNASTTGDPVPWKDLGTGSLAILCWTVVFLLGAAALFRRREL